MQLAESALYIALLGILLTLTSAYVTILRGKTGILFGDGGNDTLARARRAHTTVLEFGVTFLLLMIAYELLGGSATWIMWLAIAFIITRLIHVLYQFKFDGLHFTRAIGTFGSHIVNIIFVVLILVQLYG